MASRRFVLDNALIINEGRQFIGHVIINGQFIETVGCGLYNGHLKTVENLGGKLLIPGVIDTHVHFREPGLTHKATIRSESIAAAAGGVTSYIDMPNCKPTTTTSEALEDKFNIATENSYVNYSFYIGATEDNIDTLRSIDYTSVPGIKLFLGQSTGDMRVSDSEHLDEIFSLPQIVSIHSEDQDIIDANMAHYREMFPDGNIPMVCHPLIRSAQACIKSTEEAVARAEENGTHLHLLHVSTAEEASLFRNNSIVPEEKNLTSEVCVQHLWFTARDYHNLGSHIKCNPAIKGPHHRRALRQAVADGYIDVVSTDHAPHTRKEKEGGMNAPSGMPMIQFSLQAMIDLSIWGYFSLERVVEVMCHNPARLFAIDRRGFIRPGYYADLAVVDMHRMYTVTADNILSKCGWSPFEGTTFRTTVVATYVNGKKPSPKTAMPLKFVHRIY